MEKHVIIVTAQVRHFSPPQVVATTPTQAAGECLALSIYHSHGYHQVAVIEVNPSAQFDCDRYAVLAKITRTCLHPGGFQGRFDFTSKRARQMCEACNLAVGDPINLVEVEEVPVEAAALA